MYSSVFVEGVMDCIWVWNWWKFVVGMGSMGLGIVGFSGLVVLKGVVVWYYWCIFGVLFFF